MVYNGSRGEGLELSDRLWNFADCEFDELRLELRVHGKPVEMELKPLEILLQLLRHAGEVVTKEELLEAVWPGLMVVDGSLATAVSKLRKALGDDQSSVLLTVSRVGYRLVAPVRVIPPVTGTSDLKQAPPLQARTRTPWIRIAAVAFVLLLLILGVYERAWLLGRKVSVAPKTTASLAVLP
jgi:DNA-binding winged helix-turn-helix (wHTH) protein